MSNDRLYKFSLICGAVPLILGTAVFAFWFFSHWSFLTFVGLFTIYGGIVSVVIGVGCLITYLVQHRRITHNLSRTLKSLGLLLVNFPVAVIIILTVIHLETTYFVTAKNTSNEVVDSFKLTAPGVNLELGPIQSGQKKKASFQIAGDGSLRFSAVHSGRNIEGTLENYVTNGLGGHKVIEFNAGGDFRVLDKRKGI